MIGQTGLDPGTEWGTGLASTADNTLRRKQGVTDGDPNGTDAFDPATQWDGFDTDTFGGLGTHTATPPDNAPVSVTCPPTVTTAQGTAATAAVSATDADGTVTSLTIGSVTPAPAAATIALTGFAPATADGGTASATLAVAAGVPPGSYVVQLTAANDDATPQTGTCSTTVNVTTVLRVSEVQGAVSDLVAGPTHRSALAPLTGNGTSSHAVRRPRRHHAADARAFVRRCLAVRVLSPGHPGAGGRRPDHVGRDLRLHGELHDADRGLRAPGRR